MVCDMAYTHVGCVYFIVVLWLKFHLITIIQLYVRIVPLGGAVIFYSILYLNKIHFTTELHTHTHTFAHIIFDP